MLYCVNQPQANFVHLLFGTEQVMNRFFLGFSTKKHLPAAVTCC